MAIEYAAGWNQWAVDWCATAQRRLGRQRRTRKPRSKARAISRRRQAPPTTP
jgi:hypothetical protein